MKCCSAAVLPCCCYLGCLGSLGYLGLLGYGLTPCDLPAYRRQATYASRLERMCCGVDEILKFNGADQELGLFKVFTVYSQLL